MAHYIISKEEHFVKNAVKVIEICISSNMLKEISQIDAINQAKRTEGKISIRLGLILCKEIDGKHRGET